MPGIRAILLAAGASSRFGSNKLLHPIGGVTIAQASARNLAAAMPRPLAVIRPHAQALEAVLRAEGCEVVVCPDADDGMGVSLACAVRASAAADGWIVALADMPFVKPSTIALIAGHVARGAPVAAPVFRGQRGHPVCFSSSLRGELLSLAGDEGARRVFQRHGGPQNLVEVDDPGVLRDIDVPADIDPAS